MVYHNWSLRQLRQLHEKDALTGENCLFQYPQTLTRDEQHAQCKHVCFDPAVDPTSALHKQTVLQQAPTNKLRMMDVTAVELKRQLHTYRARTQENGQYSHASIAWMNCKFRKWFATTSAPAVLSDRTFNEATLQTTLTPDQQKRAIPSVLLRRYLQHTNPTFMDFIGRIIGKPLSSLEKESIILAASPFELVCLKLHTVLTMTCNNREQQVLPWLCYQHYGHDLREGVIPLWFPCSTNVCLCHYSKHYVKFCKVIVRNNIELINAIFWIIKALEAFQDYLQAFVSHMKVFEAAIWSSVYTPTNSVDSNGEPKLQSRDPTIPSQFARDKKKAQLWIHLQATRVLLFNVHSIRTQYLIPLGYMIHSNVWTDLQWMAPNIETCLLARYYPAMHRVSTADELPVITGLHFSKYYGTKSQNKHKNNLVLVMLYLLAKILVHRKCYVRNLSSVIEKPTTEMFPVVIEWLRHIFFVSLTGGYAHAVRRPGFAQMAIIFHNLMSIHTDNRKFLLFCESHYYMLFFAIREHIFHAMRCNGSTYDIEQTVDAERWFQFVNSCFGICEFVREQMCGIKKCRTPTDVYNINCEFDTTEYHIKKFLHVHTRILYIRQQEKRFELMLYEFMKLIITKAALSESELTIDAEEFDLDNFYRAVEKCYTIIRCNFKFDVSILSTIGVSKSTVGLIREWYFDYAGLSEAPHSFKKELQYLQKHRRNDFMIIFQLFQHIAQRQSTWVCPWTKTAQQTQARILRIKYSVLPTETMPEHTGIAYYCRKHDTWLNPIVTPESSYHNSERQHELYMHDCYFDLATKRLHCKRGKFFDRTDVKNQCDPVLEKYDLLGNLVCINGVTYGLCSICGCITTVANANIFPFGFSCLNHGERLDKLVQLHNKDMQHNPPRALDRIQNPEQCFFCQRTFSNAFESAAVSTSTGRKNNASSTNETGKRQHARQLQRFRCSFLVPSQMTIAHVLVCRADMVLLRLCPEKYRHSLVETTKWMTERRKHHYRQNASAQQPQTTPLLSKL